MIVRCTNAFKSKNFTTNKEYECEDSPYGLTVIDDSGEEHIIAKKLLPNQNYEDDNWFRERFIFILN